MDGSYDGSSNLAEVAALLDTFVARDDTYCFPSATMRALAAAGVQRAVLPHYLGGSGLGTVASSWRALLELLLVLGAHHLSVGRLVEGHINAFALLWRYGDQVQRLRLVDYVEHGGWLGVWNAPHPDESCWLEARDGAGLVLRGRKAYASGAGGIERPLITATDPSGALRMVWLPYEAVTIEKDSWQACGMRATCSATVHFAAVDIEPRELFGEDNAYHEEPHFSGGAWRFLAVQLGAATQLVHLVRQQLVKQGRADAHYQRARLADCTVAVESARLWVMAAAREVERENHTPETARSAVYRTCAARMAVDQCIAAVLADCQRSIGLRMHFTTSPLERLSRDLQTYLQQPMPDANRDRVGQAFLDGIDFVPA